jgi:hypothetical protein
VRATVVGCQRPRRGGHPRPAARRRSPATAALASQGENPLDGPALVGLGAGSRPTGAILIALVVALLAFATRISGGMFEYVVGWRSLAGTLIWLLFVWSVAAELRRLGSPSGQRLAGAELAAGVVVVGWLTSTAACVSLHCTGTGRSPKPFTASDPCHQRRVHHDAGCDLAAARTVRIRYEFLCVGNGAGPSRSGIDVRVAPSYKLVYGKRMARATPKSAVRLAVVADSRTPRKATVIAHARWRLGV